MNLVTTKYHLIFSHLIVVVGHFTTRVPVYVLSIVVSVVIIKISIDTPSLHKNSGGAFWFYTPRDCYTIIDDSCVLYSESRRTQILCVRSGGSSCPLLEGHLKNKLVLKEEKWGKKSRREVV